MYERANSKEVDSGNPSWMKIQGLAFSVDKDSFEKLTKLILDAECISIRLPVIRTAVKDCEFKTREGIMRNVKKGETIILDIVRLTVDYDMLPPGLAVRLRYRANIEMINAAEAADKILSEAGFLNHKLSVTEIFADYDPKYIAAMSVTVMIKVIAQMKNVRGGHGAQDRVKKVNLDRLTEGYSNCMALMRITRISRQTEMVKENTDDIYNDKILRPATDTYPTAGGDEIVPFSNSGFSLILPRVLSQNHLLTCISHFSVENPLRWLRSVRLLQGRSPLRRAP